ncbi:MAG: DNA-binding protein [Eubacteriales bacterium]
MEKIVEQGILYDFYGELLTKHQRKIYEDAVYNDLSISEIASEEGISRQGVFDLLKRVNKTLEDYEQKLHLVQRFRVIEEVVHQINEITSQEEVRQLSSQILEEL